MKKDVRQTPISCKPASAPSQSQVTGLNDASASSASASTAPHAPSRSQTTSPHATQTENSTSRSQTTSPHATQPANATQPAHAPQPGNATQPPQPAAVGTFTCLYESKDKKYCLFADENGHLTSVKAHRLS